MNKNSVNFNSIRLFLSNHCDENCYHCPDSRLYSTKSNHLTLQQVITKITSIERSDWFVRSTSFLLTGGEPAANPDLFEIIHYLKKFDKAVVLATNGIRILKESDFFSQILNSPLDGIIISLEASAVDYKFFRQTDYFPLLLNVMKKIKLLRSNLRVSINVVVCNENLQTFSANIEKLNLPYIDKIRILSLDPINPSQLSSLSLEQEEALKNTLNEIFAENTQKFKFLTRFRSEHQSPE